LEKNEPLNLLIFDGEIEMFFSYHRQQITEGMNFMLSSILFRNFAEVTSNVLHGRPTAAIDIESALRNFYREVNGCDEIIDRPIPVNDFNFNYRQMIKGFDPGPDEGGDGIVFLGGIGALRDDRNLAGSAGSKRRAGDHEVLAGGCG
jgi:hypothetical protein